MDWCSFLNKLRSARLILVWTPPFCNLMSFHFTDATGRLFRWRLGLLPSSSDCAASDQGPGHRTVTYGLVAGRRPPMWKNRPTPHVPQPLLPSVRRLRASLALTDCGVALLTEQARGGARQV